MNQKFLVSGLCGQIWEAAEFLFLPVTAEISPTKSGTTPHRSTNFKLSKATEQRTLSRLGIPRERRRERFHHLIDIQNQPVTQGNKALGVSLTRGVWGRCVTLHRPRLPNAAKAITLGFVKEKYVFYHFPCILGF